MTELDVPGAAGVPVASRRSARQQFTLLDRIDAFLFGFAGLSAIWLAYLLVHEGVHTGWRLLLLVLFWVVFTYLLLPRLHRILTTIYVPNYFIGRARTSDGLLGDPVNLALLGHEAQIHAAMDTAGWTRADDLSMRTGGRIISSTLTRRSYARAPVSPLHLFDRQQDFAYQQEVAGNPAKRHHVRFWRCPSGWLLPGGARVDWLAAGTYDRSVGLSLFTLQITHKIEANTDIERDFIVESVRRARPEVALRVIENFASGYHSRNGGGDLIETDGDLPILALEAVSAPELAPGALTDSRDRRPAQIVFGGGVMVVQGVLLLLLAVAVFFLPRSMFGQVPGIEQLDGDPVVQMMVRVFLGGLFGVVALAQVGIGVAVLAGQRWARLLSMLNAVVGTIWFFFGAVSGTTPISVTTNLPTVTLSILILLSLSSHRAREYTTRRRLAARKNRRPLVLAGPGVEI